MNLLLVVGLACAAVPQVAAIQQGEPHREATHKDATRGGDALAASDCPLDDAQLAGGPSQQDDAKRRAAQKWWQSAEGRAEFAITDQQSKDIEAVFQSLLPQLRVNKADLDKQEKVLSQLLSEANSNEALIVQAIDRVEAARSALSRTRTLMLYRMYRLLSAEQRAKVQAYHERKSQEGDNRTAQR
jgi:Spy/CpxP family protein refolding chaperone